MFPFLFRKEIEDEFSQENFRRLGDYFKDSPLEKFQFKFFEIPFTMAVTNFRYPHNLGFSPKDVITTFVSGGATVTWNYDSFDSSFLDITTSGPTTVRALVGRYAE